METHASQPPALRARIRRSLIQLGSLLAMALVIVGVFAMFSVWSLNRAHMANYEHASRLMFALDDGRSAQTLFKIQVQEWKNILLRGSDQSDFKRHLDAFAADETKVQHHLDSLAARADGLGLSRIALGARSMAREHRALGEAYRAALDKGRSVPWDPFTIDRQVRGIDRPLNTALDKVAVSLLAETEQRRSDSTRREEARYRTLRAFMAWSIAVSIGIVGLVLWKALRRRPDRA